MDDTPTQDQTRNDSQAPKASTQPARRSKQSLSMHDGIGVWCDCCSCEPEPRWIEVAEELGIDLSDFEKPDETEPCGR